MIASRLRIVVINILMSVQERSADNGIADDADADAGGLSDSQARQLVYPLHK